MPDEDTVPHFDGTQKTPWKILGFHDITYANAIIQHPSEVMKSFRRISRIHHPDKCKVPAMKDKKTEMMKQINEAKSMILVTDVLKNGLPKPNGHAQQLRERYADQFLETKEDPLPTESVAKRGKVTSLDHL